MSHKPDKTYETSPSEHNSAGQSSRTPNSDEKALASALVRFADTGSFTLLSLGGGKLGGTSAVQPNPAVKRLQSLAAKAEANGDTDAATHFAAKAEYLAKAITGNRKALYDLGRLELEDNHNKEAWICFIKAAKSPIFGNQHGYVPAMKKLAKMADGYQMYDEAELWRHRATEASTKKTDGLPRNNCIRSLERTQIAPVVAISSKVSAFEQHWHREQISEFLHYLHWIPQTKGFARKFMDDHYPGWTYSEVLAVIRDAEIVKGLNGAWCDERVIAIHFDHRQRYLVQWFDGTTASRT